jgi:hypothetical protein
MSAVAFKIMHAPVLERMTVTVSDDESAFDPRSVPDRSDAARALTATVAADTTTSFLVTKLWAAPSSDMTGIPFVRRIIGTNDGEPTIGGDLQDRLVLGTARRLEVMLGIRGSNARQPRERYSF